MSTTLGPIPTTTVAITPNARIAAAQTPADIVRAMLADPAIRAAILSAFTTLLGSKSALESKTVWAAILVPVIMSLAAHFGLNLDQAMVVDVVGGLMGVLMLVLRTVSGGKITSVMPEKTPT